ncbi:MAG: LPS export ABC transporter periplasmic protein LptC [Thermodesulfovibrionales bacterium]|jgi:LPS export ABC transporter protein LptC
MKKRIVLPIFLVVSLIAGGLVSYLTMDKGPLTRVTVGAYPFMEDVSIKQRKEGAVSFVVNARKAVFISNSNVRLTDLTMLLPDKGLTLRSNSGVYNIKDKSLRVEGAIRASTDTYRIDASSVLWDASTKELTSSEKVTIEGEKFSVQGTGLEATSEKAKLSGNVKAVFNGQ